MILSLKLFMRNVMLQNSILPGELPSVLCVCQYFSKPFIRIATVKGVTSIEGIEKMFYLLWFLIIFTKQPTNSTKFKNDWTKRLQKITRKINLSLSLDKRKLAEKNEWSGHRHACFDIPHKSPYLEHDFMITNLVRLDLIFWKYWRRPRNILVLC